MDEKTAMIHLFRNMDKYYFYDVNKNKIANVTVEIFNLLQSNLRIEANNHPLLKKLKIDGFLSCNRVEKISHISGTMLEDLLNNKLRKITLQITQNCNFRCSYCVYSGNYIHRDHSNKRMNWETAKKGIDFLINRSKDSTDIDISFYGGEPLLEINLVNKCMEYAIEAANGKSVSFSLTTNGSLLNEEVAHILLKHNIKVTISLDGPREVHDKSRKFAANGCGTFDTIYNNLKKVTEKYPEFRKRLSFSMVIDPTLQLSCLNDFIASEEEVFNEATIVSSFITNVYRKDKVKFSQEFVSEWQYCKFKYLLYILGRVSNGNNSQLIRSSYINLFDFICNSNKPFTPLPKEDHHAGPCIPGQIRLFMNTDGDLFPCERVNESSDIMKIGNVDKGFNLEKVEKILNIGKLTEENCKTCFAFRNCTVCASMADNGTELSKEVKLSACQNVRFNFEEMLKDACTLKEYGISRDMIQVIRG